MLLNGVAAGLVFLPATSAVLADVAPEHAGSASGLLQTFQQLGGAIGLAVIVSVYAAGAVPGRFLPGAEHAFLTSALFALTAFAVAVLATLRLHRTTATATAPAEAHDVAEAA
jgi:MFS family permease